MIFSSSVLLLFRSLVAEAFHKLIDVFDTPSGSALSEFDRGRVDAFLYPRIKRGSADGENGKKLWESDETRGVKKCVLRHKNPPSVCGLEGYLLSMLGKLRSQSGK